MIVALYRRPIVVEIIAPEANSVILTVKALTDKPISPVFDP